MKIECLNLKLKKLLKQRDEADWEGDEKLVDDLCREIDRIRLHLSLGQTHDVPH